MNFYPKLMGERLYLSPEWIDDESIRLYTGWVNDPAVSDGLGITSMLMSEEKEREFLTNSAQERYNFAVVHREENRLMGNVSLFDIHHPSRRAECGLFIGEKSDRGKGYGREALCLLLRHAFQTLNLNSVMLRVYAFNEGAVACYEKVGFEVVGVRRESYFLGGRYHDEILMDILAEDFFRKNPECASGERAV